MGVITNFRYKFGIFFLIVIMVLYLAILFQMQIGKHLFYDREANVFLSRLEKINASRGEILDSNSNVLANNLTMFILKISLQQYYNMPATTRIEMIDFLSSTLDIDKSIILSKLQEPGGYLKDVEIIELTPKMLFKISEKSFIILLFCGPILLSVTI